MIKSAWVATSKTGTKYTHTPLSFQQRLGIINKVATVLKVVWNRTGEMERYKNRKASKGTLGSYGMVLAKAGSSPNSCAC
jgi:hypothetical protein